MELAGKVALVTGGGRGIGRAIALALARAGADVAVAARSTGQLEAVAAEIAALGRRSHVVAVDLTAAGQAVATLETVAGALGPVQILVNNAGVAPSTKFTDLTDDQWRQTMALNVDAPFYLTRAAIPAMLKAGWGRVINVASTASKIGYKYTVAYTASKHAVLGLTRALALEYANKGITVNAICPGYVESDITDQAVADIAAKTGRSLAEARKALAGFSPQNRLMQPDEVAALAVYLASPAAAGVNGQGIVLDGGGVQS